MIAISCPNCSCKGNVPNAVLGREVRCPNAAQVFVMQHRASAESLQAAPPTAAVAPPARELGKLPVAAIPVALVAPVERRRGRCRSFGSCRSRSRCFAW